MAPPSLSTKLQPLVGRRVLLTGHTGFKGGWLALWLRRLGAEVVGISLPPRSPASFFQAVSLEDIVDHRIADIRLVSSFKQALDGVDAELIVHMAGQSLVLESYGSPIETFETNIVGTAVVLEAARAMPSLRAAILVTSDKCYESTETARGYHKGDRLGGADPSTARPRPARRSSSTPIGARSSRIPPGQYGTGAGGKRLRGGDWAANRLVPDLVASAMRGDVAIIRNPRSVRPWQHVLDALSGYLVLASALIDGDSRMAGAWKFGPDQRGYVEWPNAWRAACSGLGATSLRLKERPTSMAVARRAS